MQRIHAKHEDFLILNKHTLPTIGLTPVIVLDCNEEFETDEIKLQEHINTVKNLMSTTQQTFKPAKVDWQILRQSEPLSDIDSL